jgi:hypothetical protein
MALPIRDGNQSLTTLSTLIISNSHVPAHTVVSFGTQGITDIATAVSGVLTDSQLRASAVTIGGGVYLAEAQVVLGANAPAEAVQVGGYNLADNKLYPIAVDNNGVQSVSGTVTANLSGDVVYTNDPNGLIAVKSAIYTQDSSLELQPTGKNNPLPVIGTKSSDEGGTQLPTLPVQLVDLSEQIIGVSSNPLPISGTVSLGNGVGEGWLTNELQRVYYYEDRVVVGIHPTYNTIQGVVTIGSALPAGTNRIGVVTIGAGTVTLGASTAQIGSVTASGTVTANLANTVTATYTAGGINAVPVVFTKEGAFGGNILGYDGANTSLNINIKGSLPSLVAGTAQIGSVTASISGTPSVTFTQIATHGVTIGAGTAQIGSVTASGTITAKLSDWELIGTRNFYNDQSQWAISSDIIKQYSSLKLNYGDGNDFTYLTSVYVAGQDIDLYWFSQSGYSRNINNGGGFYTTSAFPADLTIGVSSTPSNVNQIATLWGKRNEISTGLTVQQLRSSAVTIAGTVTLGAGTAQIGSVTVGNSVTIGVISNVVTISNTKSSSGFYGSFSATTATQLLPQNLSRKGFYITNEGAGILYIQVNGGPATNNYMARLNSGDYYELPNEAVTQPINALFVGAGNAQYVYTQ